MIWDEKLQHVSDFMNFFSPSMDTYQRSDISENSGKSDGLVFVSQMVSKQPGLVPRMDGRHSRQRIYCVTIHLDCSSELTYSHM